MDQCISFADNISVERHTRCLVVSISDEHRFCRTHYVRSRPLYKHYKYYTDLALSSDIPIIKQIRKMPMRQIQETLDHLLHVYRVIARCVEKRRMFRKRFVHPDARDAGHIVFISQLLSLHQRCENALTEVYQRIDVLRDQEYSSQTHATIVQPSQPKQIKVVPTPPAETRARAQARRSMKTVEQEVVEDDVTLQQLHQDNLCHIGHLICDCSRHGEYVLSATFVLDGDTDFDVSTLGVAQRDVLVTTYQTGLFTTAQYIKLIAEFVRDKQYVDAISERRRFSSYLYQLYTNCMQMVHELAWTCQDSCQHVTFQRIWDDVLYAHPLLSRSELAVCGRIVGETCMRDFIYSQQVLSYTWPLVGSHNQLNRTRSILRKHGVSDKNLPAAIKYMLIHVPETVWGQQPKWLGLHSQLTGSRAQHSRQICLQMVANEQQTKYIVECWDLEGKQLGLILT